MVEKTEEENLRFLADGMLGRLAQWLRILGADCLFFANAADGDLQRIAESENRVLLTRDAALAARLGERSFFVHYQRYPDQVRELLAAFPAVDRPDRLFTRCVACNGALAEIPKGDAEGVAPPEAFRLNDRFWRCLSCSRTFWRGSHTVNALRLLREIKEGPMGRSRF